MSSLYLSRIRLRPEASQRPEFWAQFRQQHDTHRLVWSFFQEPPGSPRSFLFRQDGEGEQMGFYVLSRQRPTPSTQLWQTESSAFAPKLSVGQRLMFSLRANAVQRVMNVGRRFPELSPEESARLQSKIQGRIDRREARDDRPRPDGARVIHGSDNKHDVVMMRKLAQRHLPEQQREPEPVLVQRAGLEWLRRQAQGDGKQSPGAGFRMLEEQVRVDGYRQHRVVRRQPDHPSRRAPEMCFSTLDFQGLLEVTDPEQMMRRLWAGEAPGLGASRGFGCGLVLVRRPSPSWLEMAATGADDEADE